MVDLRPVNSLLGARWTTTGATRAFPAGAVLHWRRMDAKDRNAFTGCKAVLWDNDGVLVDTESLFFEVSRVAFARMGLRLTKEIWGADYLGEGKPSRQIALAMGADPARIDNVLSAPNQEYRRILRQPPVVRRGVRETLKALFGRYQMAVVTGCDREQFDLVHETTGLPGFFDLIVTSDDCPHPKPNPELYLLALRALRLSPSECIAVEDSPRGVAAAQAAGIASLAVPTELTSDLGFKGALAVAEDVSKLLEYLPGPTA